MKKAIQEMKEAGLLPDMYKLHHQMLQDFLHPKWHMVWWRIKWAWFNFTPQLEYKP